MQWIRCTTIFLALVPACTLPTLPPLSLGAAAPTTTIKATPSDVLTRALQYPHNPAVRAQAVEALEDVGGEAGRAWIRSAMLDAHPAVRFAACMAVGRNNDASAEAGIEKAVGDEDANVRVAALFARHRLGRKDRTGELTTYLLDHQSVTVRRNAALALGLLGEQAAIKVLARAMRDRDAGVRQHALEAMSRLGNRDARQELAFMANTGVGSEEVFALNALANSGDRSVIETFRYKLANADHTETKLAAARGLAICGSDEGYTIALEAVRSFKPVRDDRDDPAGEQVLRVRQLAAAALGAIGRADANSMLDRELHQSKDPRLQVSLARAILEISSRQTSAANLP